MSLRRKSPKRRQSIAIRLQKYFSISNKVLKIVGKICMGLSGAATVMLYCCPQCERTMLAVNGLGIIGKAITEYLHVVDEV